MMVFCCMPTDLQLLFYFLVHYWGICHYFLWNMLSFNALFFYYNGFSLFFYWLCLIYFVLSLLFLFWIFLEGYIDCFIRFFPFFFVVSIFNFSSALLLFFIRCSVAYYHLGIILLILFQFLLADMLLPFCLSLFSLHWMWSCLFISSLCIQLLALRNPIIW